MKQNNFETFTREDSDGNKYNIICFSEPTRNGFKHVAVVQGWELSVTVNYSNRTWESYRYETVIDKLMSKIEAKK